MPTFKKPPERRIRRNKPRLVESIPPTPPPEPQAHWRPETKENWAAFWGDSVARAVSDANKTVVDRYFAYYDEWERSLRPYKRWRFIPGSNRQPDPFDGAAIEERPRVLCHDALSSPSDAELPSRIDGETPLGMIQAYESKRGSKVPRETSFSK